MKRTVLAVVLALGLGVFAALPASAESGTREAEITYRSIKIVIDGQEICPRDAAGNEVEPFILDGTTYLPVRAVADALGLEVFWRSSDSTVLLSDPLTGSAFRDALPLPPAPPAPASESAHGHSATESVTLGYRDIRLLLDGAAVGLRDAAGNEIEPFILDGTTYLPVRAVAQLLDRTVSWDAETSTVMLSTRLLSRRTVGSVYEGETSNTLVDTYEYDSYGRLIRSEENMGLNRTETYLNYDEAGRLASSENLVYSTFLWPEWLSGKRLTSYSYDEESGLCVSAETTAEGGSVSCSSKTEYEYDALGRLTAVSGSLTRVDGEKVYSEVRRCVRSYDELGRLVAESLTVSAGSGNTTPSIGASALGTFTFRYTYDEDWRPTSAILDGIDGQLRLYDAGGDLTAAVGSSAYSYDEAGRPVRIVEYEGGSENVASTVEYSYDEKGLLSEMRIIEAGPVTHEDALAFFYDENGAMIRQEQRGFGLGDDVAVISFEYVLVGE